MKIILASASAPRAHILHLLGIPFEQRPTGAAEDLPKSAYGSPHAYCDATCRLKASLIVNPESDTIYIVADTIVISPSHEILEKPRDKTDARRMLTMHRDSGQAELYTSMCIMGPGGVFEHGQSTQLQIRNDIQDWEIDVYLETFWEECCTGSGALAIMGSSARWIEAVHGCFYNGAGLSPGPLLRGLQQVATKMN